jgi:hypothetical protein
MKVNLKLYLPEQGQEQAAAEAPVNLPKSSFHLPY